MTLKARITAIDRFIKGCKEDGIYDDLNAACVMAGWDSLAGALTPLKGAAPSNNGFLAADYDRGGIGLKGDGSSKYLNSNRANNADGQDDQHLAVYVSATPASGLQFPCGASGSDVGATNIGATYGGGNPLITRSRNALALTNGTADSTGIAAVSRYSLSHYQSYSGGVIYENEKPADALTAVDIHIFQRNSGTPFPFAGAIPFYSIGSAINLALLDARVSTLMADLRAIEETGFDRDAIAYIRAVEEADGAYLETDVKVAINNLVSGLKSDGLWDAMASTCLLCGPRTLAGALVPLRGDAPEPNGFVSGDYSRSDGLKDAGGTSYLLAGIGYNEVAANDEHVAVHLTELPGDPQNLIGGGTVSPASYTRIGYFSSLQRYDVQTGSGLLVAEAFSLGFVGASRSSSTQFSRRQGGSTATSSSNSSSERSPTSTKYGVFCANYSDIPAAATTTARFSFFSIGSSIDLAKLDSHISSYVTAIGAAV